MVYSRRALLSIVPIIFEGFFTVKLTLLSSPLAHINIILTYLPRFIPKPLNKTYFYGTEEKLSKFFHERVLI